MIVNQSALKGIFVGFNTIFNKVFRRPKQSMNKLHLLYQAKQKKKTISGLEKFQA